MRLSLSTLDRVPELCERPAYDVAAARIGIVHLGVGAFHRAHQAVYLDDRLRAGETSWAVCGASLRRTVSTLWRSAPAWASICA